MTKKYIRFLIIGFVALIATACSISPDTEDRPELNPVITSISAPSITDVINDNSVDSPSITIMWNPVDKASFYVVEYQSALDYLAGDDYREFITQSNSFSLGSQYFTNSSDMRYVFRVKAAGNTQIGSSIIYSPYSELSEGVIVNTFTVSPVIQDSVLNLYSSFPKIRSVLSDSSIVSPEVKYYDGDYTDGSSLPEPLSSSSIKLSSAEEKIITAVLSVDGKEVARKKVTAENSIDYYPPHLYSIEGSKNGKGAITITWTAPEINKGLDKYNAELKFAIERQKDGGNWESLKDSSGNDLVLAAEDVLSGNSYTYSDTTAEPNADYKYRVITEYFMTINENDVVYAEDKQGALVTDICYTQDTMVKSFMITPVSGFDGEPVTSGDAEYEVQLEWESYHDLPDNLEYSVTRWDFDQITFVNGSPTDSSSSVKFENAYTGSDKSFTDKFSLDEEKNKKAYNYVYYIQMKDKEDSSIDYPMVQSKKIDENGNVVDGIIKTNPSIKEVSFIKDGTLKATSGNDAYSDKIVLSWSFDEESIASVGLSADKVSVHILKKTEDDSLYTDLFGKDALGIAGTEFYDTDVEPGIAYNYMLRPYYNDSESLYNGAQATYSGITIGSTLKGVTGLSASMNTSNSEISVYWDKADYAHGYKVYYRKSGESSWKEMKSSVSADDSSCILTKDSDGIVPGTVYEITAGVIDASGSAKPDDSIAVKGSILGNITPDVTGKNNIKADSIVVSWDKVENATSYKISIYDDTGKALAENKVLRINDLTEASGKYEYTFSADSDEFRAYAEATDDDGNLINEYALSREYRFSVVPVVRVGSTNIEPEDTPDSVEGYWIMPPKNITATKAEYRDMVTVSWSEIGEATRYNIYRRKIDDSSSAWENCGSTNKTSIDIECADSDQNTGYEYTVSSFKNSVEGQLQDYFEADIDYPDFKSNFGINLIKPNVISGSVESSDTIKIVFDEVPFATGYYIKPNGYDEELLDISNISSSKLNEGEIGYASCENGVITYYARRPLITLEAMLTATVRSYNENAPYDSNNTSFTQSIRIIPSGNYLYAYEIVNLTNSLVHEIIADVNTAFNGDWWIPYDTQPYTSRDNTIYAEGCATKTLGGLKDNAYIRISGYSNSQISLSGEIGIVPDSGYNGLAGYLDIDPPEYITDSPSGNNTINVTLPYKLGSASVSYKNVYLDGSKGTYSVVYNGQTLSVESSQVQVRPY